MLQNKRTIIERLNCLKRRIMCFLLKGMLGLYIRTKYEEFSWNGNVSAYRFRVNF